MEKNFSIVTLIRIVSDGHFLTKGLKETSLENVIGSDSDMSGFIYLITFPVIF